MSRNRTVLWAVLFLGIMTAMFSTVALAAGSRGVTVKLKASEAAGAPISETVRLYSNSHALVIGIDNYTNGWPRLSNAIKDAQLIERELRGRGFNVQLKTNLAAGALEEALENFFIDKGADPNARLLVWFAGHGHTERGKGYLVPADGPLPQKDTKGFRRKALSMRRIGDMVRDADAKHVLAVFDSCFAGTVFESARTAPPPAITRVTTQPVRQFLTSGDAGQTVADDGKFRRLFIEALQGKRSADANADGYLTASELGLYLTDSISNYTSNKQTPHYGKLRDPDFDRGDFVFKMASLGASASAPESGGGMTPEMLFWQSIQDSTDPDMFAEYLRQYPTGSFGGLARLKMKKLQGPQIASLPPTPEPVLNVTDMDGRYVALKRANVRAKPNAKARKLTTLDVDTLVTVTGRVEGADWYRIAHAGGDAYVWKPLLETVNEAEFSAWSKIKGSKRHQDFEKFLKAHPKGLYADRASRLLAALTPVVARPAPRPQSLHPGTTFRDCDGAPVASAGTDLPPGASFCGPQMVVIPAGSFDMGDLGGVGDKTERPVHRVTIPRPFAVGVYEVTQAEWSSVMGINPSHFMGARNPVERVSWDDAKRYLKHLSAKTGERYRLLSEAEWEYAARAGSKTEYPWGNHLHSSKANYGTGGIVETRRVGSFSANAFGLYDTAGNVWEWTQDCWNESYNGAPRNGEAWETGDCRHRILRGDSWGYNAGNLRSAFRLRLASTSSSNSIGFRVARTLDHQKSSLPPSQQMPTAQEQLGIMPSFSAVHTVVAGDTFSAISRQYGVSMYLLAKANGLPPPYLIRIGQKLRVPEAAKKAAADLSTPHHSASVPQPSSSVQPAVGIFPKTYKPGNIFKDCTNCPQMVVVPAGSFDMGDLNGGGEDDENPVHRVTIPRPFAVGIFEVTQAEWLSVLGTNPSRYKGDSNPVESVNWKDAKDFLKRLSAKTGKEYRLLSEAEWEYAARANSRTKYPWGNSIDSSKAKYSSGGTSPVGSYAANAFGLFDTSGNVWEWTEDAYLYDYIGAPNNGEAWTTGSYRSRVLRGGSWSDPPGSLRSANRGRDSELSRDKDSGFRVARTLDPQETALLTTPKAAPNQIASVRPGPFLAKSSNVKPAVGVFPKTYKPGDTFRDCADCPKMVVVPAGSFMMGSPNSEREWSVAQGGKQNYVNKETPQHNVRFSAAFAVGKFEVSKGQYAAFVRETGHSDGDGCYVFDTKAVKWNKESDKSWRDPNYSQLDSHPAVCVSWKDAQAYLAWLSRKTGQEYRLLSEAEWEYAARAGTTTMRYWGDDRNNKAGCAYGNVSDSGSKWGRVFECSEGYKFTSPVGTFRPNGFGLHDMLGNAWEWTEDCWNANYNGSPSNGAAWTTGECRVRVLRGGSWSSSPGYLRSAIRFRDLASDRYGSMGFRIARTVSR